VLRVPLRVEGFWWERPSMWLFGTVLIAALTAAGVFLWQRQRTIRLLREQRLRAGIAADLHDEVGGLLTRMALRAEMLQALTASPGSSSPHLDALISESREAAIMMRDIIWSVDAGADTIGALADRMRDYLDQTARATQREITFDDGATPTKPSATAEVPLRQAVRQHAYLIFKEAVTNALKYSDGGQKLHVVLRDGPAGLELRITNDGPVVPAPTARSGKGLRSMHHRANQLAAYLSVGPQPSGGWQVALHIPEAR
jgi:signal transduction histidine kinase